MINKRMTGNLLVTMVAFGLILLAGCSGETPSESTASASLHVDVMPLQNGNLAATVSGADLSQTPLLLLWSAETGELTGAVRSSDAVGSWTLPDLDQAGLRSLATQMGESLEETPVQQRGSRLQTLLP